MNIRPFFSNLTDPKLYGMHYINMYELSYYLLKTMPVSLILSSIYSNVCMNMSCRFFAMMANVIGSLGLDANEI